MVDASLARLGTNYIDLYYLHRLPPQGPEEFFESLKPLVASGKVRSVGISEASCANLRAAHAIIPLAAAQYEWSLVTRDLEADIVPACAELGITLVAYSPLSRNLLAGTTAADNVESTFRAAQPRFQGDNLVANQSLVKQTVAEMAVAKGVSAATLSLAWLLQHSKDCGCRVLPIPGSTKIAHALENISAQNVTLTPEDMSALENLATQVSGARGNEGYLSATYEGQKKVEAEKGVIHPNWARK
jgi:aryl-alcohol dehydrogenase-like predicted oxidoreductase